MNEKLEKFATAIEIKGAEEKLHLANRLLEIEKKGGETISTKVTETILALLKKGNITSAQEIAAKRMSNIH